MILVKENMLEELEKGNIHFSKKLSLDDLNPNSIDVSLSNKLVVYTPFNLVETISGLRIVKQNVDTVLDCKQDNKTYEIHIPEEGIILSPDMLFLGATVEKAGSIKYIPMYEGRSSLARLGLSSHLSAGFGDVGFKSNWTLEIIVKEPLKIYPNMRIGQVYFIKGTEEHPKFLYAGKYNDQDDPCSSRLYLDFKKGE